MTNQSHNNLIFVVDDEAIIADTLATILRMNGYTTNSFTNPIEALKSAKTCPPDLLISDVAMPEMSGVDLAVEVKALIPKCRILLFSGQATTVDLLKKARSQGHHFELLPKPVRPGDLLLAIKEQFANCPSAHAVYTNNN